MPSHRGVREGNVGSGIDTGDPAEDTGLSRPGAAKLEKRGSLLGGTATVLLLLFLGTVEGWMGRTVFATDAISYLDISRALPAKDWKMVFNPLWSVGYPFLLALMRPLFPATPQGDWLAIHILNLLIFLGAWAAFLYLLHALPLEDLGISPEEARRRRKFIGNAGLCVFIAIQLCIDSVSRVGPDLLVTCLFFLAIAIMLRLLQSPGAGRSIVLGCVLGIGYWVKGIFLPLSLVVLVVAAAALHWRKSSLKYALLACAAFVLVALPYAAGLSWSYGRFTLGEAGPLNYAFHVNLLPRWTNWQGGPLPVYGTPIHPTRQVLKDPDVFVFGEPYHNTYPPFGNIAYWYEGYRHFWSPKLQAIGILRNSYYLAQALVEQPIFYAVAIAFAFLWTAVEDKRAWLAGTLRLWPYFAPALVAIALYAQVHLEARYLGSFLAILSMLPFLSVCLVKNMPPRKIQVRVLAVLAIGAALNLAVVDRQVFENIHHRSFYTNDPEWKLGLYLHRTGLKRGEEVAAIGGPNASSTWAYMDGLRIVAELGGDPYDQRHPRKGSPQATEAEIRDFWHDQPAVQHKILSLFQKAGAVAVVAPEKPASVSAPGWRRADDTDVWVYRF